jgi:hypothetical protein
MVGATPSEPQSAKHPVQRYSVPRTPAALTPRRDLLAERSTQTLEVKAHAYRKALPGASQTYREPAQPPAMCGKQPSQNCTWEASRLLPDILQRIAPFDS